MMAKVAVIAGGGGVLGEALVREFTNASYSVATLRRDVRTASSCNSTYAMSCDLADEKATTQSMAQIISHVGEVDVLIYNAAHLVVVPFAELRTSDFTAAWQVSVSGAVACIQAALPGMLRRKRGTIIFSGATASIRGGAHFAAFSAAKFALRGLAQSLAREYQAQGIHVAHVVLDGLLRGSPSIARFNGNDSVALDPAVVAQTYRWLVDQPDSAWTHELDLRPNGERF